MENVKEDDLIEIEKDVLKASITGGKLKVFIWEENAGNIPDSEDLKLVILKKENREIMENILQNKGQTPRVYRNTIFFLYPLESERSTFIDTLKRKIAYEYIEQDQNLNLSDEQKKTIKKELRNAEGSLREHIRRLYRKIAIPDKEGLKYDDLGIPTYGEEKALDQEVYEKLRCNQEILKEIAPLVLKEKYLLNREYVPTEQLYQSSLKTPGEARPINKAVLELGISLGVQNGIFGLGELVDGKPICRYFKKQASIAFSGNEILISEKICYEQTKKAETSVSEPELYKESDTDASDESDKIREIEPSFKIKTKDRIQFRFRIPKGKVAGIMGVINLLQSKFENLEIELLATEGSISEQDYENKIIEAFRQLGIKLNEK